MNIPHAYALNSFPNLEIHPRKLSPSCVRPGVGGESQLLVGITDVSDQLEAQEALTRSLQEKETLLKEIHHRVKNNLQIISSLLMLQSDQLPEGRLRDMILESIFRVRSMALVHQQLYGVASLERIELGDYTRTLANSLRSALVPSAHIRVDSQPVTVPIDMAVPLGLILNELLTNAFKYGRGIHPKPPPQDDICVEIGWSNQQIRIVVADSGPGFSETELKKPQTLGFQLIRTLVRQLRGELFVANQDGARVTLLCPPEAVY